MLERISNIPDGIFGVSAKQKVSKKDYDAFIVPFLEEARRKGERIRFLYHFGPEFDGFTAQAAWEDLQVGVRYLRLFERCAVVTDFDWVRRVTRAMGALMPCPIRIFSNDEFQQAVYWLKSSPQTSVSYRVLEEGKVLLIEPRERLSREDFDALESTADFWIESAGGSLEGWVVHAPNFPGWQDLGSFLRHIRFIRDHQRKAKRIALAVDGKIAEIGPSLAEHFIHAQIKQFGAEQIDQAIAWAGGHTETNEQTVAQ